jgi:hypothetical protein
MSDILLSNPLLWMYVLYVVAILVAAFWADRSGGSSAIESSKQGTPEQAIRKPGGWRDGGPNLPTPMATMQQEYSARFARQADRVRQREDDQPAGGSSGRVDPRRGN